MERDGLQTEKEEPMMIITFPPSDPYEARGIVLGIGEAKAPRGVFSKPPNPDVALRRCMEMMQEEAKRMNASMICGASFSSEGNEDSGFVVRGFGTAVNLL